MALGGQVELPLPPSQNRVLVPKKVNGKWRHVHSSEARLYKEKARLLLFQQKRCYTKIEKPAQVLLRAWVSDTGVGPARDNRNSLKLLEDCLTGLLFDDDVQVVRSEIQNIERGMAKVVVRVLDYNEWLLQSSGVSLPVPGVISPPQDDPRDLQGAASASMPQGSAPSASA